MSALVSEEQARHRGSNAEQPVEGGDLVMSGVRQVHRPKVKRRRGQVTQRELRVLLFAAAGYTVNATAQRLGVSAETIRCQRDACRRKLGATSIANAAALAAINGLFSAERQEQIRQIAARRLEEARPARRAVRMTSG